MATRYQMTIPKIILGITNGRVKNFFDADYDM